MVFLILFTFTGRFEDSFGWRWVKKEKRCDESSVAFIAFIYVFLAHAKALFPVNI
jgi:hypothetical protein